MLCGLLARAQEDAVLFRAQHQTQWDEAGEYSTVHHAAWKNICDFFEVDQKLAQAVVFPEMVRYNLFRDRMETAAVKGSYVSRGTKAFDFSIGRFQMKPSFVEGLEKRWMRSGFPEVYKAYFDTEDTQFARRARIERLSDDMWQYVYLAMFIKLFYLDYGSVDKSGEWSQEGIESLPPEDQVRLLATAYNRGCRWVNPGVGPVEEIAARSTEHHFHLSFMPTESTPRYVYGDIALLRWEELD